LNIRRGREGGREREREREGEREREDKWNDYDFVVLLVKM
jgi:hypothetical protein